MADCTARELLAGETIEGWRCGKRHECGSKLREPRTFTLSLNSFSHFPHPVIGFRGTVGRVSAMFWGVQRWPKNFYRAFRPTKHPGASTKRSWEESDPPQDLNEERDLFSGRYLQV